MNKTSRNQCYISIENDKNIGRQLFKLAYLINILISNKSIKRKIVFHDNNNLYYKSLFKGLFNILDDKKFNMIKFNKISSEDIYDENIVNYSVPLNIEICSKIPENLDKLNNLYSFKNINNTIGKKIIDLVYSNEDLMYEAYYKYRDMLNYFGNNTNDDEVCVLHIMEDIEEDIDYYINALAIMNHNYNIKNIAVITDDITWAKIIINDINIDNIFKFYYFPSNQKYNYEINFIVMSMFKNIIITNKKDYSMDSLWASYISYYDNKKIVASSNIREIHKYITDII